MLSNTGNNEPIITLHLPLSHVNAVLQGLGELPLKVSRPVVVEVERQANEDLRRQQEFLSQGGSNKTQPPTAEEPVVMPAEAAEPQ